jgi:hypothetical protein
LGSVVFAESVACPSRKGRAECPQAVRRARVSRRPAGLAGMDSAASTSEVESRCGAVAVGRTYLLLPLSSGGAPLARPWLRFYNHRCSSWVYSSLLRFHYRGRPAHRPFRGLLSVNSRCGLHTRAVTVFRDRYPGAPDISSPPCLPRLLTAGAVVGWALHPLEAPPCHGARGNRRSHESAPRAK